jgi:hypothetical protein
MTLLALALWGCTDDTLEDTGALPTDSVPGVIDSADTGDTGNTGEPALPDHPYLMSFHTCDPAEGACGDPQSHQVHVAGSDDGLSWEELDWVEPFPSSVPDLVVRDGILYVYGLPQLRRYDLETHEVLPLFELEITDSDGAMVFHADPSMLLDDDGRIVMFFLEGLDGQDPASCPDNEPPCTKRILSATEVEGTDGHGFVVDEGARAEVLVEDDGPSRVSDPDVALGPDGWVMLLSRGQNVQVHASDTLRGTYEPVSDRELNAGSGGVPATQYVGDPDGWWLYVTSDLGGELSEIRRAPVADWTERLDDSTLTAVEIGPDPLQGVIQVASPGIWAAE